MRWRADEEQLTRGGRRLRRWKRSTANLLVIGAKLRVLGPWGLGAWGRLQLSHGCRHVLITSMLHPGNGLLDRPPRVYGFTGLL